MVSDLMCANGDILKFAGDAILTLWQCDESQFPATIDRVVTAAINIQCKMDNYMTGKRLGDVTINVIIISCWQLAPSPFNLFKTFSSRSWGESPSEDRYSSGLCHLLPHS